jgi:YD repeat-containing protein
LWNNPIASTHTFYDGVDSSPKAVSALKNITRVRAYTNIAGATRLGRDTTFTYDPNGNRLSETTYDALDRPLVILEPGTIRTAHRYGVTNQNEPGGVWRVTHDLIDPNRHRTQWRTDTLGRLASIIEMTGTCGAFGVTCGAGETAWDSTTAPTTRYSYDLRDRLTQVTDAKGNLTTIGYDTLGRKTSMSDPDMGAWSYAYDPNGNLTSKTGVGAYQYGANLNGAGAGPHQARTVNGQAYTYDANGNLLTGGGRTYTWNDERLPASVASGGVTESYTYDADGERVTRTRSGTTTRYLDGLWEVSGSTTQA